MIHHVLNPFLAAQADGSDITTIEGVSEGAKLHPIQQAFVEHGSAQCGFCTPGMILSAKSLLDRNPDPSEGEVRVALAGNLCRCDARCPPVSLRRPQDAWGRSYKADLPSGSSVYQRVTLGESLDGRLARYAAK